MKHIFNSEHSVNISDTEVSAGFIHLLSTPTIFSMDLIGKNLQMNNIETQVKYSNEIDAENEPSLLYVKMEQQEQALSILTSLDLLDFTMRHDK